MTEQKSSGLQENVAGLLCYLFWLAALILLFVDTRKFVRFHAIQSLLICVAMIPVSIVVGILFAILLLIVPALGGLLWFVFVVAVFVLLVMLMIKTYKGQMWKLPIIGNLAEKWANK